MVNCEGLSLALYHVFPATFHVISRKMDFLWDRVASLLQSKTKSVDEVGEKLMDVQYTSAKFVSNFAALHHTHS